MDIYQGLYFICPCKHTITYPQGRELSFVRFTELSPNKKQNYFYLLPAAKTTLSCSKTDGKIVRNIVDAANISTGQVKKVAQTADKHSGFISDSINISAEFTNNDCILILVSYTGLMLQNIDPNFPTPFWWSYVINVSLNYKKKTHYSTHIKWYNLPSEKS